MTAVAVVTPSSGSNSATGLFWVVGADTVSSFYVACGDVLLWPRAGLRPGDRSSIEARGRRPPRREGRARGPLPRTDQRRASGALPGPVRRVPHERGDRPGRGGPLRVTRAGRAAP